MVRWVAARVLSLGFRLVGWAENVLHAAPVEAPRKEEEDGAAGEILPGARITPEAAQMRVSPAPSPPPAPEPEPLKGSIEYRMRRARDARRGA